MLSINELDRLGDEGMVEWVQKAQSYWLERKTDKSPETVQEWINHRQKITIQNPGKEMILLYNMGGREYLASCLLYVSDLKRAEKTSGFIADSSTYYYYPKSEDEGKYLCSVINSRYLFDCIRAIKSSRAIHLKPWEFPIPWFDPDNTDHKKLVKLYEKCCHKIKSRQKHDIERDEALELIADEMPVIDNLVKKLCAENYQKKESQPLLGFDDTVE